MRYRIDEECTDSFDEIPDLVSLYASDLRQFQPLSDSQQFWLGIAIDSGRMLERILKDKNPNDKKVCEYIYIGIINKIRETHDLLANSTKFRSKKTTSFDDYIVEIITEIIEFKTTTVPVKRTVLNSLFNTLPDQSNTFIFDLIEYIFLLPPTLLDYYQTEIIQTKKIPSIAHALNVLNPLHSVEEIITIRDRIRFAKEMLIEGFLKNVKYSAYKFRNRGLDFEDVIQEGNIGLITAIDKYDVRKGVKFNTYAHWWVRQRITRAIANDSRTIRFPVHLHDELARLSDVYRNYQISNIDEPSILDLAEMSDIKAERVSRLIDLVQPLISLENLELCENSLMRNYISCDYDPRLLLCPSCPLAQEEAVSFEDMMLDDLFTPFCLEKKYFKDHMSKSDRANKLLKEITDNSNEDELKSVQMEILRTILNSEFEHLSPRYYKLLELRYGLKDGETMTLDEVGQKLGVTRERIRQIESSALDSLRRSSSLNRYKRIKKKLE